MFIFSSDYLNWQKAKLAEKSLMILNVISEYRVCIFVSLLNLDNVSSEYFI